MTSIEQLAEFVTAVRIDDVLPNVADTLRLHLCDTIVSGVAGGKKQEAVAIAKVAEESMASGPIPALGLPINSSVPMAAFLGCVAVRCTEIDDIHMTSCTTPGSVIVPTVLALAHRNPQTDDRQFLSALLAGYEVMTRFGRAVEGPVVVYKGTWPTYLSSGLGASAAAARMMNLSAGETAHALAAAVTMMSGRSARISGLSSRWLTVGCSVHNALVATIAAAEGYRGDLDLLGGSGAEVAGVKVDAARLVSGLGHDFEAGRVSIKPYCAAKQTLSAITAFLTILDAEQIEPMSIESVVVAVPSYYRKMIDHPEIPDDGTGSIVSVQYQLALAAYHRDRLTDVVRTPIFNDSGFLALMRKTAVEVDTGLDDYYPESWPARVTVRTAVSDTSQEIHHTEGDFPDPFTWQKEAGKANRVLGGSTAAPLIGGLVSACRHLAQTTTVKDLLGLMQGLVS